MAQVLCKGKPYTPPVLHGYEFVARFSPGELPPEDAIWAADVAEKDFHKFMLGEQGSPFWLEDESVEIPPPPAPVPVAPESGIFVPGSVPSTDPEAAARLQLAAAASGALEPTGSPEPPPPPADAPSGAPDALPGVPDQASDAAPSQVTLEEAFAPYASFRSKLEIADKAAKDLGLTLDPEGSKMADMLESVRAELTKRVAPAPLDPLQPPQA